MYIYTISYSGSPELVRYVGKCTDPDNRLGVHKYKARKNKDSHLSDEFAEVLSSGQELVLKIIDECNEEDWERKEDDYIKVFKASGAPILNKAPGGKGSGAGNRGRKNPHNYKKVSMYSKEGDLIKSFESIVSASEFISKTRNTKPRHIATTIAKIARGYRPSAYGYKWKFECQ